MTNKFIAETSIAHGIRITDGRSQYDDACKRVLAEKSILAWILKTCIKEFAECSIEDIRDRYLDSEPKVGVVPVLGGGKNSRVKGIGSEDAVVDEGVVRYDIIVEAWAPVSGELIKVIINIEAQNKFYPGYSLIKRGIFNCSRMISAQHGSEFENSDYNNIKRVYSLWVCMNVPKYKENTITKYSMTEENIIGYNQEEQSNYDLITTIMIYLGKPGSVGFEGVIKLLGVLLSNNMNADEKKQVLEGEFKIEMTEQLKSEVSQMCNLSQGILQEGVTQGVIQGVNTEKENIVKKMLLKGWDVDQISELTDYSVTFINDVKSELIANKEI